MYRQYGEKIYIEPLEISNIRYSVNRHLMPYISFISRLYPHTMIWKTKLKANIKNKEQILRIMVWEAILNELAIIKI